MDHVPVVGNKMVVENHNDTFKDLKEPAVAETAKVANALPDPVLQSAKALLDSMSTSSAKIAKMLKPVSSPARPVSLKASFQAEPNVKQAPINQSKNVGLKIGKYDVGKRKPAVMPLYKNRDINLKTTVASNEITLTLEPVTIANSTALQNVPYYARGKSFTEFRGNIFQANVEHLNQDKVFEDWHRKHVYKLLRYSSYNASSKLKSTMPAVKHRNGLNPYPPPYFASQVGGADLKGGQKRKYCAVGDRYYQYLNKPKRAKHDAFQIIFRSHILFDPAPPAEDEDKRTLYPRKFLTWPSGKVIMPGYHPRQHLYKNYKRSSRKKRTWSAYRIPKPIRRPIQHISQNRYTSMSGWRKPINKKLSSDDRFKWDPLTRKFYIASGQHKEVKTANPKQWFRFPSAAALKNTSECHNLSRTTQAINCLKKKYATVATTAASNWRLHYKPEPSKSLVSPVYMPQKLRDISVILKCSVMPQPVSFQTYKSYSDAYVLFLVRRVLLIRTLKQSHLDRRVGGKRDLVTEETRSGAVTKKPSFHKNKKPSLLVLATASTESMLSLWSLRLEKIFRSKPNDGINLKRPAADSHPWYYHCKRGIVENISAKYPQAEDQFMSKKILHAWALDEPCNDTSTGTHIIDSDKPSTHYICNKADISNSGDARVPRSQVASFVEFTGTSTPKMHPSQSRIKYTTCMQANIRKRNECLPQPSYCVRFRGSFCNLDCSCDFSPPFMKKAHICHQTRPMSDVNVLHCREGKNMLLTESRKVSGGGKRHIKPTTVPDDVETTISSVEVKERSAYQEEAMFLKDELSHEDGREFGSSSMSHVCNAKIVKGNSQPDDDEILKDPEIEERRLSCRFTRVPKCNGSDCAAEQMSSLTLDRKAVYQNGKTDIGPASVPADYSKHATMMSAMPLVSEPLAHDKLCDIWSSKASLSVLARYEHRVTSCLKVAAQAEVQRPDVSGIITRENTSQTVGGRSVERHCSHLIGGDCLEARQTIAGIGKRKTQLTDHDSSNNAPPRQVVAGESEGMGNNLRKQKLFSGLGTILQVSDCSDNHHYLTSADISVLGGGLTGKKEVASSNSTEETSGCKIGYSKCQAQRHDGQTEWKAIDSIYDGEFTISGEQQACGSVDAFVSETTTGVGDGSKPTYLRSYANAAAQNTEACLKSTVSSRAPSLKFDAVKDHSGIHLPAARNGLVRRSDTEVNERFELGKKKRAVCRSFHNERTKSLSDDSRRDEEQETRNAEGEYNRDHETRSSRRLRSRKNCKKRGRYETDYVSDIPKASKKPKKVFPTNEYDNDEFWQFYSRCENTVYSQNLLLQYKYIKLFKSKGLTVDCSSATAQFGNILSTNRPSNGKRPVVPDSGVMPFLEKFTKQKKTIPDVPKLSDHHCAYCGRSFTGSKKGEYEDHVLRHGMKHTVLSVPLLPKKNKKLLKRPPKTSSSNQSSTSRESLPANSRDQKFSLGGGSAHNLDELRPFPRPSLLSMGHRKQTARKSFSIASTLPKKSLIAALECKMRAQSNITSKTDTVPVVDSAVSGKSDTKLPSDSSFLKKDAILNSFLPEQCDARKTLTGLPITYNHLHDNYL